MTRTAWRLGVILAATVSALVLALNSWGGPKPPPDPQIGQAFRVPYRLTETNHFLVRVRINGKGLFNFLVDSGAPALFVATETAKKIGLEPDKEHFWTAVDRLEIEGGARLAGVKARVEDPFQLVGMNALGLPGASIDGILGFTILARFRLEIDLTRDRMTWTRLDNEPRDPPVPDRRPGEEDVPPAGVQAMNALGPLAKGLAFLMGKQPEDQQHPRGFLGLEWSERSESGRAGVEVRRVLAGSPADQGGLKSGDLIVRVDDRAIGDLKAARTALAEVQPGDEVPLVVRRGNGAEARELKLKLTAGEGL